MCNYTQGMGTDTCAHVCSRVLTGAGCMTSALSQQVPASVARLVSTGLPHAQCAWRNGTCTSQLRVRGAAICMHIHTDESSAHKRHRRHKHKHEQGRMRERALAKERTCEQKSKNPGINRWINKNQSTGHPFNGHTTLWTDQSASWLVN